VTETVNLQIEIMERLYDAARRDGERDDARDRAGEVAKRLGVEHKAEIVIMYLAGEIERIWRAEVKANEKKSANGGGGTQGSGGQQSGGSSSDHGGSDHSDQDAGHEPEPTPVSDYEMWYADPSLLDWGRGGRSLGDKPLEAFIKWLGDRRGEYFERGRRMGLSDCFLGDFAAEGAKAYQAAISRMNADRLIDDIASRMRDIEVTPELLESYVALGDGTRIKYGDLTIPEAEQRLEMYVRNYVNGNATSAAFLRRLINQAKAKGVTTFRELA